MWALCLQACQVRTVPLLKKTVIFLILCRKAGVQLHKLRCEVLDAPACGGRVCLFVLYISGCASCCLLIVLQRHAAEVQQRVSI